MEKILKEKIAKEVLKSLMEKDLFRLSKKEIMKCGEKTEYKNIFIIYPEFESIGVSYFKNIIKNAIDKINPA